MRAGYAALFFVGIALVWGVPNGAFAAIVFYAQTDASVQSIPAPVNNSSVGQVFIPAVSGNAETIAIRVIPSENGSVDCSRTVASPYNFNQTSFMRLAIWPVNATSSKPMSNDVAFFSASSTAPDANGNCFYNYTNGFGVLINGALIAGNAYMVAIDDEILNWRKDLYGGSSSGTGSGYFNWISVPGYDPHSGPNFIPGNVGVSSYFMTISDTTSFISDHDVGMSGIATSIAATSTPTVATTTPAYSNILFLPGIEGSRLYEGIECGKTAEEKLWEPYEGLLSAIRGAGDDKVRNLFLDQTGESVCDDIYAKEGDIIDSASGDIYKSFIAEMNGLKTDGTIKDWKPVAYDWRLSLDDLLNNGAEQNGKIYYAKGNKGATSTPYIEQTLRALAGSSKTGKVTIVAHSSGGLVAKALLNKLGDAGAVALVDKVIMVGAPQSGAPLTIGALLYGYDQGLPNIKYVPNFIVSASTVRALAENSPMAYHLLPSQNYLDSVATDTNHPVARFAGDAYASEISAYGATITSTSTLDDFLLASTTLNSSLIDYANSTHATLDNWTPPAGIEVDQIAGWGADTVAGIDFYTPTPTDAITALEPQRKYNPIFTEDGDGTVPVPSALMMASSTNVKRYWVNLFVYNNETNSNRTHKDLFEIPSLRDFVKNIIENSTSTLPTYILSSQPPSTSDKKLTFFLHSPLTLQLTDSSENVTGIAEDGSMTQDISGSTYGEFGDVKYITVPEGNYQLAMHGQASGTFSLDMQETSGGIITASSTIANVPTTASTLASLTISGGINTASALSVDENGDGQNIITLTPKIGETVVYEPPAPAPAPSTSSGPTAQVSSSGGRGGSISIPVITPTIIATTSPLTDSGLRSASTTPTTTDSTTSTSSWQAISPQATIISSPRPSIAARNIPKRLLSSATVANTMPNFSQTASVYAASQQSFLKMVGTRMYTGFYRMWIMLTKLF